MNVIEKLYLLFITLNMNDEENEEKVCGISTKFIKKLIDFFLLIMGEQASTNSSLNKTFYLIKMSQLTCLYGPIYIPLHYYPPHFDKTPTFLRQK